MSTPQDPPKRNKQKARRTKKLAEWREKQEKSPAATKTAAKKTSARKPAAKK